MKSYDKLIMVVYVAGKLNDDAVGYIKNLNRMARWGERIRKHGFSVFVPGLDFLMGVIFGNWNYDDYFDNSQPQLLKSDAVFVTPGYKSSAGTKIELNTARAHGIPVFFRIKKLLEYRKKWEAKNGNTKG